MRLFSLLLIASALLRASECHSVPELREGRIEVLVSDSTGQRLNAYKATLTGITSPRPVTPLRSHKQKIPYGDYVLRIELAGFKRHEQTIHISAPDNEVRAELEIAYIGCPYPPSIIRGQIQNLPVKQEIWAKAVPLRGPGGTESRVHGAGYFELRGLRHGSYILLLTTADRVLHQQIVVSQEPGRDSPILSVRLSQ